MGRGMEGGGGFGHTQTHRTIIGSNYSKEIVANLLLASLHALLLHQHGKVMGQREGERMEVEEVQGGYLQKYRVSIIAQLLHSCRVISIYKQLIFLIYPRRAAPAPARDTHLLASRRDMPLATCHLARPCSGTAAWRKCGRTSVRVMGVSHSTLSKNAHTERGVKEKRGRGRLCSWQIRVAHFRLDAIVCCLSTTATTTPTPTSIPSPSWSTFERIR